MTACNSIVFELHHWGHLAELLGFEHKLAVHAELLRCVLQRLLVLSLTCPLALASSLCITETHPFGWADLVIGEAKNLLHGLELQIDGLSPSRRTHADSVASTLHCRAVALREQLPCAAMSMMH